MTLTGGIEGNISLTTQEDQRHCSPPSSSLGQAGCCCTGTDEMITDHPAFEISEPGSWRDRIHTHPRVPSLLNHFFSRASSKQGASRYQYADQLLQKFLGERFEIPGVYPRSSESDILGVRGRNLYVFKDLWCSEGQPDLRITDVNFFLSTC